VKHVARHTRSRQAKSVVQNPKISAIFSAILPFATETS
jgi:hypothetical protein